MNPNYLLTRAKAGMRLGLAAANSAYDTFAPFSQFCWYLHHESPGRRWYTQALDYCVQGVTIGKLEFMGQRNYCALSAEGDVIFLLPEGVRSERIPETGLSAPDSKQFGRMADIQLIEDQLFACGHGVQIYRRDHHGAWHCLAPALRKPPGPRPEDYVLLFRVNGPRADDVYIAGSHGTLLHWDGTAVTRIDTGLKATLIDILVESEAKIWVCGEDGTLLVGNRRNGFRRCNGLGTALLQRMTRYEDRLYLAASIGSPAGLLIYENGRSTVVPTGLSPEPTHPHIVDAAEGVLWVVSVDDIVRFDGKTWERIDDFPASKRQP